MKKTTSRLTACISSASSSQANVCHHSQSLASIGTHSGACNVELNLGRSSSKAGSGVRTKKGNGDDLP